MSDKPFLTADGKLIEKFGIIDPVANTGQIAMIDPDGTVYLDWSKIESAAINGRLIQGQIVDRTMWAFAIALLAVRDKTWLPLK